MIQRRQTVYLIFVLGLAIFLIAASPVLISGQIKEADSEIYTFSQAVKQIEINTNPMTVISMNKVYYALIISGLLSLVSIFLFKRRDIQIRSTAFNFIFIALSVFYIFYTWYQLNANEELQVLETKIHFAIFLPFLMIICNFLALRGIRKDIELLASADRLR